MPCYYDNKRFNKIQFVEVFLCGFSFALTSFNKMNSHKEEPKQGQVFFPDHLLRKKICYWPLETISKNLSNCTFNFYIGK
ncbi:hypothetical protein MTP99_003781 [Tenebrio molitor]|nr:hypothetical protein MTP99_003781 [Tenebrio molitor]